MEFKDKLDSLKEILKILDVCDIKSISDEYGYPVVDIEFLAGDDIFEKTDWLFEIPKVYDYNVFIDLLGTDRLYLQFTFTEKESCKIKLKATLGKGRSDNQVIKALLRERKITLEVAD